ncbi:hypothetical protein LRS73_26250 [Methylobacterium currus]|uniref:hypothetical protein n=1 Tax=Methylobacterium currus TaxID=2051553 RepID=UPI001E3DF137|nr:hypothetical protein [Methylobacterium currus]UHC15941.1 hypothetical protein LRS73_26250 [Methylobacterium currus]
MLDTNLMALLIASLASHEYILRHERTQANMIEDLFLLQRTLGDATSIATIPHVLAETSKLVRPFAEPGRTRI